MADGFGSEILDFEVPQNSCEHQTGAFYGGDQSPLAGG